jgi:hypothetical protein
MFAVRGPGHRVTAGELHILFAAFGIDDFNGAERADAKLSAIGRPGCREDGIMRVIGEQRVAGGDIPDIYQTFIGS